MNSHFPQSFVVAIPRWLLQIALLFISGGINAYPPVFEIEYSIFLLPPLTWSIALLIPTLDTLDDKKRTPFVFACSMVVLWYMMAFNAYAIGSFFWQKNLYSGIVYVGASSGLTSYLIYNFFITKQFKILDAVLAIITGILAFALAELTKSSTNPVVAQRSNVFMYWQVLVGVALYFSYQRRLYRNRTR